MPYFSKVLVSTINMSSFAFTSATDYLGMTFTYTLPANLKIRLRANAGGQCVTASNYVTVSILEGATGLSRTRAFAGSGNERVHAFPDYTVVPTAGSHTYKLQLDSSTGGTSSTGNSSSEPYYFTMELV